MGLFDDSCTQAEKSARNNNSKLYKNHIMKIKYIVLTVIIVAVSFIGYSYYQSNKNNDKYIEFEKQAQNDIKNNKKKYYHFGFVPMNKQNDLYDVLNKNNVQIINMDCAAIPELVHYNDMILSSIK